MDIIRRPIQFAGLYFAYIYLYYAYLKIVGGIVVAPTNLFYLLLISLVAFVVMMIVGTVALKLNKGKTYQVGAILRLGLFTTPWAMIVHPYIDNLWDDASLIACRMYPSFTSKGEYNLCGGAEMTGLIGDYTYGTYAMIILLGGHLIATFILTRKAMLSMRQTAEFNAANAPAGA